MYIPSEPDKIISITLIVDREGNSAVQVISLITARTTWLFDTHFLRIRFDNMKTIRGHELFLKSCN